MDKLIRICFSMLKLIIIKILYIKTFSFSGLVNLKNLSVEIKNRGRVSLGSRIQNRDRLFLISDGGEIVIGNNCYFNTNCSITSMKKIQIGNYSTFGNNVVIVDHDHDFKNNTKGRFKNGEVLIGDNVWIGANCVILKNTIIGNNVVIGAGSVVKGTIPSNTVLIEKHEYIKKSLQKTRKNKL